MRYWDSLVATGKCQDMGRKVDSCLRENKCLWQQASRFTRKINGVATFQCLE